MKYQTRYSGGKVILIDNLMFKVPTILLSIYIANGSNIRDYAWLIALTTLLTLGQALFENPISAFHSKIQHYSFRLSNLKHLKWKVIWILFVSIFAINFFVIQEGNSTTDLTLVLVYLITSLFSEMSYLKLINSRKWTAILSLRAISIFVGLIFFSVSVNKSDLVTGYLIFITTSQAVFLILLKLLFSRMAFIDPQHRPLPDKHDYRVEMRDAQTMSVTSWFSNQTERAISIIAGSFSGLAVLGFFSSAARILNDLAAESLTRYFRVQIAKADLNNLRAMSSKIFKLSAGILTFNVIAISVVFHFNYFSSFASYKFSLLSYSVIVLPTIRNMFVISQIYYLRGAMPIIMLRKKIILAGLICGIVLVIDTEMGLIAMGFKECLLTLILTKRKLEIYQDFEHRFISYALHLGQILGMIALVGVAI
jgi:hypothetical protein